MAKANPARCNCFVGPRDLDAGLAFTSGTLRASGTRLNALGRWLLCLCSLFKSTTWAVVTFGAGPWRKVNDEPPVLGDRDAGRLLTPGTPGALISRDPQPEALRLVRHQTRLLGRVTPFQIRQITPWAKLSVTVRPPGRRWLRPRWGPVAELTPDPCGQVLATDAEEVIRRPAGIPLPLAHSL